MIAVIRKPNRLWHQFVVGLGLIQLLDKIILPLSVCQYTLMHLNATDTRQVNSLPCNKVTWKAIPYSRRLCACVRGLFDQHYPQFSYIPVILVEMFSTHILRGCVRTMDAFTIKQYENKCYTPPTLITGNSISSSEISALYCKSEIAIYPIQSLLTAIRRYTTRPKWSCHNK